MNRNARFASLSLVVAAAAALAGCAASSTDGHHGQRHADAGDFGHVHGLVVSESEKVLVGTHHGVYSIEDGSVRGPLGEYQHDMMSFVGGPGGEIFGSGHPDHDSPWAGHMGLIRSRDGGETWENLSLLGQVDFHDLEIVDGRFYGYDSQTGKILVSDDGVAWSAGQPLALFDFAVSPDGATIVGATPVGLARSVDDGASFSLLMGSPDEPMLVQWRPNGTLIVFTSDGSIFVSDDEALTWEETGKAPAAPQAAVAAGESELYIATAEGVYVSVDNGSSWVRVDEQ